MYAHKIFQLPMQVVLPLYRAIRLYTKRRNRVFCRTPRAGFAYGAMLAD
jgi:hypothetical protein